MPLLFCLDNAHVVPRIKEPELSAERLGDFAGIGCDLWCLWRNGNEYLNEEVTCGHIGGIKRSYKANVVLWVSSVKSELLMKFSDCRLVWCFAPLEFATRKGDLPAVSAALRPPNQQHLAVEWMWVNALATPSWAAAPQSERRYEEGGYHRNAWIGTHGWI